MADQVSPLGGLSAGLAQGLKPVAVPSQSKPVQSKPAESRNQVREPGSEDERGRSVSEESLESAAKTVDDYLQQSSHDLQFSVDKDTGMYCVKVVDPTSQEVIRQVPSEEALKMAKRLQALGSRGASGVLMDSEG